MFIIAFSVEGGEVDCVAPPLPELSKTKEDKKKEKQVYSHQEHNLCLFYCIFARSLTLIRGPGLVLIGLSLYEVWVMITICLYVGSFDVGENG